MTYGARARQHVRHDQALNLWVKGRTYEQIAEELGWKSRSGAYQAVQKALERHATETDEMAQHGRMIALARLRPLWQRALELALGAEGSSRDILAAAQIADRMQRLEGVKDPAHEVRLTVETELDREISVLMEALTRHGADPVKVLGGLTGQ